MHLIRRITSEHAAPATLMVAVAIPVFFGLLILCPPAALVVAAVAAVSIARNHTNTRIRREEALAKRRATWGY